jgi:outer membrane murein-binding lipoprotein Lpp
MFNIKMILAAAAACMLLVTGAYFKGRWDGASACDSRHARAQMQQSEKERKADAKRDREKPVGADRRGKLDWLLQYGRP